MSHRLDPRSRAGALGLVVLALVGPLPGCYVGLGNDEPEAAADGAESADDDGTGGAGGDESDGGEPACAADIGPSTQRRLTRFEYDNSIRDLFGTAVDALFVDGSPAAGFSVDEKLGRFDANAISPLGTLGLEHYMTAAEQVGAEIAGHLDAVLGCDPVAIGEDECARQFIAATGRRIYRRQLVDAELDALFAVMSSERTAAADEADPFGSAIGLVVTTMLQSPHFLYHLEIGEQPVDSSEPVALTSWELASRLSFFLWAGPPDDALLDAAAAGTLVEPDELATQAQRMIADARFERALVGFHRQWLGIDGGNIFDKDLDAFPEFTPQLAAAMRRETELFVVDVLRSDDARLSRLFTANIGFVDADLAEIYGIAYPPGATDVQRVELPADERAGLLTQASVMATHTLGNQTSPIRRGLFVRENLLCQTLPLPPNDVDNSPPDLDPNATTRERFAQHTADAKCAACHRLIDPLGFGFENYDPLGRYRTTENDLAVDASGELQGSDVDGTFVGAVELGTRLADSDVVRQCVAKSWLEYASGRPIGDEDECAQEELFTAFAAADHDLIALLLAVVQSDAFRRRRGAEEEGGS